MGDFENMGKGHNNKLEEVSTCPLQKKKTAETEICYNQIDANQINRRNFTAFPNVIFKLFIINFTEMT